MTRLHWFRMARGLVIHERRRYQEFVNWKGPIAVSRKSNYGRFVGRDLVGRADGGAWGTCKWCERPCDPRRKWHSDCAKAYLVARGNLTGAFHPLRALGLPETCVKCGSADRIEIDHRLAISVARKLGRRELKRAFWVTNLRPLCHACHVRKTTADRRRCKEIDRARADEAAGIVGLFG